MFTFLEGNTQYFKSCYFAYIVILLHILMFLFAAAIISLCGEVELVKVVKKQLHLASFIFCSAVHLLSIHVFLSLTYHVMIYE